MSDLPPSGSPEGRFSDRPAVPRRIVGYRQDEEGHWVAELDCGHSQHVRHLPPMRSRPWVLTPEGRASMLGTVLWCVRCVEEGPPAPPTPPAA